MAFFVRDVDVVRFDGLDVKRGIDSDLLGIKKRAKKVLDWDICDYMTIFGCEGVIVAEMKNMVFC